MNHHSRITFFITFERGSSLMIVITILHVIVCFALVMIVLLQAGKGAEMGAAFGGASQTIFGSSGAMGFLSKLTAGAAVLFMITSLLLAFSSTRQAGSVTKGRPAQTAPEETEKLPVQPQSPVQPQAPAPAQPQAPAPAPEQKK
jgi:preprotein translocase subunit SecG